MPNEIDPVTAQRIRVDIADTLEHIKSRWFTPDVLLTLVMRKPDAPDAYLIVSEDDLVYVSDIIERRIQKEKADAASHNEKEAVESKS